MDFPTNSSVKTPNNAPKPVLPRLSMAEHYQAQWTNKIQKMRPEMQKRITENLQNPRDVEVRDFIASVTEAAEQAFDRQEAPPQAVPPPAK